MSRFSTTIRCHPLLFHTIAFTVLLLCSSLASSQQFWESKPWTQWNKKEVQRLLADSPWAQSQTVASGVTVELGSGSPLRGTTAARVKDRDYANVVRLKYTAQFRSATVIRQGVVREAQLNAGYDEMPPQQTQAFDRKTELFLAPPDARQIVIFVQYETDVASYGIELQRYWRAQTTGTLANTVFLSLPGGRKLSLVDYSPTRGAAFQLLFERPTEDVPVGEIRLEFVSPGFLNIPESRVYVAFDMRKMVIKGEAQY